MSKRELVAIVSKLQAGAEDGQATNTSSVTPEPAPAQPTASGRAPCLFIDESVRSGQVVEFPNGNVTVVGSVGSGAEIIAGGSIHVYGTLRGRALAGTAGDPTARIVCRRLEAELLAIGGKYRLADNFPAELRSRPVQAHLEGVRMALTALE